MEPSLLTLILGLSIGGVTGLLLSAAQFREVEIERNQWRDLARDLEASRDGWRESAKDWQKGYWEAVATPRASDGVERGAT